MLVIGEKRDDRNINKNKHFIVKPIYSYLARNLKVITTQIAFAWYEYQINVFC